MSQKKLKFSLSDFSELDFPDLLINICCYMSNILERKKKSLQI